MASKVIMITTLLIELVGIQGCGNRSDEIGPVQNPQPSDLIADGVSLIRNGDFEQDSEAGWKWSFVDSPFIRIVDTGFNGNAAEITVSERHVESCLIQTIPWSNSIRYLLVRGSVKADQAVKYWRFRVTCGNDEIQYDSKGRENYGDLNTNEVIHQMSVQSEDWKLYEVGVCIPKKTKTISVILVANGTSGKVYFDDIEVLPAKLKSNNSTKPD